MFEPVHDERRIPLQPPQTPTREGAWAQRFIDSKLAARNDTDALRELEAQLNRPMREEDAARTLRRPGASPESVEKAQRLLSAIGVED